MNAIRTTHNLNFEAAPFNTPLPMGDDFQRFRVGTCEGLWRCTETSYDILAITNEVPGNGHLLDVFEFFEHSCKRDRKDFVILELFNKGFRRHLISECGFKPQGRDNVIKKLKFIR